MEDIIKSTVDAAKEDIISFARQLIRIKSVTGSEGDVAEAVEQKMRALGYDRIINDPLGNVIGLIGSGQPDLMFDSHMDTVDVIDAGEWLSPPYAAEVREGKLYGRGAVDMKGALAASVYAGYIAKKLGLLQNKCLLVSASVMEEDYDGEAVTELMAYLGLRPKNVVICEATELQIGIGHRGRALLEIIIHGKSVHASHPELGVNPAYALRRILERLELLADRLDGQGNGKGSVTVTRVSCVTASSNSVPQSISLILDRRLSIAEDEAYLGKEMESLVSGLDAEWRICDIPGTSWKGGQITLHSFLPAWRISQDSPLAQAAAGAYSQVFHEEPEYIQLGYSTNAVSTAGIHRIPTVVLGPGSADQAHRKDEFCPVEDLIQACAIYVYLCGKI